MRIPLGGSVINIPFTGGRRHRYGNKWATYTTSMEIVQMAIEESDYFLNGKIKILD